LQPFSGDIPPLPPPCLPERLQGCNRPNKIMVVSPLGCNLGCKRR